MIRKVTVDDDLDTILRLLDQLSSVTIKCKDKMDSILANPNHHYYIMIKNDMIIGIGCLFIRETLCYDIMNVSYIEDVVIDSSERGNGYGKMLVKRLLKEAAINNCYKVVLQCDPKLTSFYEGCGLKRNSITMAKYFIEKC